MNNVRGRVSLGALVNGQGPVMRWNALEETRYIRGYCCVRALQEHKVHLNHSETANSLEDGLVHC